MNSILNNVLCLAYNRGWLVQIMECDRSPFQTTQVAISTNDRTIGTVILRKSGTHTAYRHSGDHVDFNNIAEMMEWLY